MRDFMPLLPDKAREREVTSIAETAGGDIWIGLGQPGGLFRLRADKFEEIANAPAGTFKALLRDHKGRLWIATSQNGLGRIDQPSSTIVKVRRYGLKDGLSSDQIWCLVEDRNGNIYLGTARGVDRLDPDSGELTHLTSADGLPPGDIRSATVDLQGNIWFLSPHGLSKYSPQAARSIRPTLFLSVQNPSCRKWCRHALPLSPDVRPNPAMSLCSRMAHRNARQNRACSSFAGRQCRDIHRNCRWSRIRKRSGWLHQS